MYPSIFPGELPVGEKGRLEQQNFTCHVRLKRGWGGGEGGGGQTASSQGKAVLCPCICNLLGIQN